MEQPVDRPLASQVARTTEVATPSARSQVRAPRPLTVAVALCRKSPP